jgi:hypothetical protein
MRKETYTYTCDACFLAACSEDSWKRPDGWIEWSVRGQEYTAEIVIHLCGACWEKGQAPQIKEIPLGIRKYFNWLFPKAEA